MSIAPDVVRLPGGRLARSPGERANAQLKTLAHPAQAPLPPLARRADRQGHPDPPNPRDRRM